MKTVCLFCDTSIKPRSWLPFAPCPKCRQWRQVVFVSERKPEASPYFDGYMINFCVDLEKKQCVLQTSNGNFRFPLPKRKDAFALTRLLYAASQDYNVDYVGEEHVKALVQNAVDSYWIGMRSGQPKAQKAAQA